MCCFHYTNLTVKVIRDGDGDGKCQEENGNWVPCPPGTPSGTRLRNGQPLGPTIGSTVDDLIEDNVPVEADTFITERRKQAADRAQEIAQKVKEQQQQDPDREVRLRRASRWYHDDYYLGDPSDTDWAEERWDENNPEPQRSDYEDGEDGDDEYADALKEWQDNREWGVYKLMEDQANDLSADALARLQEIFNRNITGKNGKQYRVEVQSVDLSDYGDVSMEGAIYDENDNRVATFSRTFGSGDEGTVSHDSLFVDRSEQNNGIAAAFNGGNEDLYRAMGYAQIEVHGVSGHSMTGAYHWPRQGFDWRDDYQRDAFIREIRRALTIDRYWKNETERNLIQELLDIAESQDFYNDKNRLTAGDLLHWSGAKQYFSDYSLDFYYTKPL